MMSNKLEEILKQMDKKLKELEKKEDVPEHIKKYRPSKGWDHKGPPERSWF